MYFPYLRGKQFELIALREFFSANPISKSIIPIIEPVKASFNNLNTATKLMAEKNIPFALILNPEDGDFKKVNKDILSEVDILKTYKEWIPTFICRNNIEDIKRIVELKELENIMIVFKDGIDIENISIKNFLSSNVVKYILTGDSNSRIAMRYLKDTGKSLIRLDNCFIEQKRNVDYIKKEEDKFTEEHRFYKEDGFYGISDYTILSKDYRDSGMLPYAVAIHLTYENSKDLISVRHFVSDTNDDQSNIQKKFFEAGRKAMSFFENKDRTQAINDLFKLLKEDKYPGLGTIKKLSIRNHIELMNSILSEKL